MKAAMLSRNITFVGLVLFWTTGAAAACAETTPYLRTNIDTPVAFEDTQAHVFTYVNVTQEGGDLVVFGKVEHRHGLCSGQAHVDLAVVAEDNSVRRQTGLVLKHGSSRVKGWRGAAFRARLDIAPQKGDFIRLAFHDAECHPAE